MSAQVYVFKYETNIWHSYQHQTHRQRSTRAIGPTNQKVGGTMQFWPPILTPLDRNKAFIDNRRCKL